MNRTVGAPVQIRENLYQFNETNEFGPYVDSYLIIGTEKALVVDALQTDTGLYEAVRKVTDKPLVLFITHGHLDHAGVSVKEFHDAGVPIYMSHKDLALLAGRTGYGAEKDWFLDVQPGTVYDIGGLVFHAIPVNGHSQGSYVLLDYENELLFSGDSIGSGHFWMQLANCSPLSVFQRDLDRLAAECAKCPELLVFPGHRNQSPVQLTGQYVQDVKTITDRILDGTWKGKAASLAWRDRVMQYHEISYGQMVSYCYNPENL